jgi:hypothetical protein
MKTLSLLLLFSLLCGSCSSIFPQKKVECCEQKAACCYGQMCGLPRYATAAGVQPKAFTPEMQVYSRPEDLVPPPGATIETPGMFSRFNPFRNSGGEQKPQEQPQGQQAKQDTAEEKKDDGGFFGRLWPF